jgi:aminoglycoside phosphotransferase (APT) family kinase protein
MLSTLRTMSDAALGLDAEFLRGAARRFGLATTPIDKAAHVGTFHRLYRAGAEDSARLLRAAVVAGRGESQAMALECALMEALRGRALPVPRCEHREVEVAGGVRGVQLVDEVEGTALSALDADEHRMIVALRRVAQFLARLHDIHGSGFGPVSAAHSKLEGGNFSGVHDRWSDFLRVRLGEHLEACCAQGAITDDERREIESHFEALEDDVPSSLLHGDPGSHNFIVDDRGEIRAVIDWEDALLGDPLFDVASLCTFHPERRHVAILQAYGTVPRAGDALWRRFWRYFLRIALAKTVHRHRFGYADHSGRAPASQRIQLALARLKAAA